MIWQNLSVCGGLEEGASDKAKLPVPVTWQNCLCVEEHATGITEI